MGERTRFIQTVAPFKGGTKLPCGPRLYHFLPNEHGHYVAEVADDKDYDAILSIGAAYRPYTQAIQDAAADKAVADEAARDALVRSSQNSIEDASAIARQSQASAHAQQRAENRANAAKLRRAREPIAKQPSENEEIG